MSSSASLLMTKSPLPMNEPGNRIVYLSSVHGAFDNRILRKQCVSLAAAGYDVHFVVPHETDTVFEGVRIEAVPKPTNRRQRIRETTRKVFEICDRLDGDLYVFHDPELMFYARRLARRGKPVVYDIHEDYAGQMQAKHWIPGWARGMVAKLYRMSERRCLPSFAELFVASPRIGAMYRSMGVPVTVLENFPRLESDGADTPLEQGRYRQPVLVDFGGISTRTYALQIIQALGMLPQASNWRMVLGGRIVRPEIFERMKDDPGWSRVEFVGQTAREEMTRHLQQGALAAVMFSPEPNNRDIRSNRLYESLAAGMPVLVTDMPEWRRFVEDAGCGLPLDGDDPALIANALRELEADPARLQAMAQAGRQVVKGRCNWDAESQRLVSRCRDIIASYSGR